MAELPQNPRNATRSFNRSHGSFELAFAPLLTALGGLWLDRTIGTVPVFTLLFAVLGIFGASLKLYYSYRHSMSVLEAGSPWAGHDRTAPAAARSTDQIAEVPVGERA
jgi:F0F1-type ATP synthase assembly protein I